MSAYLKSEMEFMNIHGSPFVCLLCSGHVYETPTHLQLHLVSFHCPAVQYDRCPLCDVEFTWAPATSSDDQPLRSIIVQRHMAEEHLPSLLLTQTLLYADYAGIPSSLTLNAPTEVVAYRAYRCVFQHGQPAGQGGTFPFPHLLFEERRTVQDGVGQHKTSLRRNSLIEHIPSVLESRSQQPSIARPHRQRGQRTCKISPSNILDHIRKYYCHQDDANPPGHQWCSHGRKGGLATLPKLTAHVLCSHAGNPNTSARSREILAALQSLSQVNINTTVIERVQLLVNSEPFNNNTLLDKNVLAGVNQQNNYREMNHWECLAFNGNMVAQKCNKQRFGEPVKVKLRSAKSGNGLNRSNALKLNVLVKRNRIDERNGKNMEKSSSKVVYHPKLVEDLRSRLRSLYFEQQNCCRACLHGPLQNSRIFTNHVLDQHTRNLELKMIRLKKSGDFVGLVDPMKTCFQCYTILEDHFAFQVHMIVRHANRYPLVCGLCKHPLTGVAMHQELSKLCQTLLDEYGLGGCPDQQAVGLGSETKTLGQLSTRDQLQRDMQREETECIRSCLYATAAVVSQPAQLVARAMALHERLHVKQLRSQYCQLPSDLGQTPQTFDAQVMRIHEVYEAHGYRKTMQFLNRQAEMNRQKEHNRQLEQNDKILIPPNAWKPCPELTGSGSDQKQSKSPDYDDSKVIVNMLKEKLDQMKRFSSFSNSSTPIFHGVFDTSGSTCNNK